MEQDIMYFLTFFYQYFILWYNSFAIAFKENLLAYHPYIFALGIFIVHV